MERYTWCAFYLIGRVQTIVFAAGNSKTKKRKKWILYQYCDILKRMNAEVEYEL